MFSKKTILYGLSIGLALTVLNVPTLWHTSLQPLAADDELDDLIVGAPSRRVGGGSRGAAGIVLPTLAALAPNDVGKTLQASPSLYWALSEVVDKPFKFTLVYSDPLKHGIEPLLETTIEKPVKGIQDLDLAKYNVELKPNVEYQWSLSIVMDSKQGSQDIVASGVVMRVTESDLPTGVSLDKNNPSSYEEAKLFYDALQLLSEKIAENPNDSSLKQQRVALLEKVGLKEVANY